MSAVRAAESAHGRAATRDTACAGGCQRVECGEHRRMGGEQLQLRWREIELQLAANVEDARDAGEFGRRGLVDDDVVVHRRLPHVRGDAPEERLDAGYLA